MELIDTYKSKYNQSVEKIASSTNENLNDINEAWQRVFIEIPDDFTFTTIDATKQGYGKISGLEFDIRKREAVKLQSAITDYVLENNSSIQSAITLKPIEISLTGVFGENVIKAPKINKVSKALQSRLNPLAMFVPDLTVQAQQYLNKFNSIVEKIDDVVNTIGSGIDYIQNLAEQAKSKQEKAFYILRILWMTRQLITIKTDFCVLENMAIQSVDFSQGEETRGKSECTISLKQLTFGEIKREKLSEERRKKQLEEANKGKTQGRDSKLVELRELYRGK